MVSRIIKVIGFIGCAAVYANVATAQLRFELVAPQLGVSSQAVLTEGELVVTSSQGSVTRYVRDARFDTSDGQWIGFHSPGANQILRWPASHTGNMQIGQVVDGTVQYRSSQMTIRPIGGLPERTVDRPVLPPDGLQAGYPDGGPQASEFFNRLTRGGDAVRPDAQVVRMASYDENGLPWLLARGAGRELNFAANATDAANWWVTPAAGDMVRVQTYDSGRIYAISAQPGGNAALMPLAQDPRQLWRVAAAGNFDNRFVLANVQYPGACLTRVAGVGLAVQPIQFAASQLWVPLAAPSVSVQPFWRSVSRDIQPNPGLPPAQLELANSHRYALLVLLGDSRQPGAVQQMRIEPNASVTVTLERDAGATLIEKYEIRSPLGVWEQQQFVTAIPPAGFYDLSVYEEHLQSIAIDRTGKSPNPIEDVNYVPKSVGWLLLPAGPELPARSRLDVYQRAQAANNPGAVRRLDPKQFDERPQSNPLESILEEFQSTRRRSF